MTAPRKRYSKSDFTFLSIFIVITRTRCLFHMKANSPGVDFLRNISAKFRRRKKISSSLVYTSIKREIRHFHVVVKQGRQRNVQKSVMHVYPCRHHRRILRSLLKFTNTNVLREHEGRILRTLVYYRCFVSNEGRSTRRA